MRFSLRPRMSWVAPGKFFFHLGIAVFPEVREIFGHLPGALVGRQDVDEEGNTTGGDGGGDFGLGELGELGGEKGIAVCVVGDFGGVSGFELDAFRAVGVEKVALLG